MFSENDICYPWLWPIVDKLTASAAKKKLAHAWIFYGQAGLGKRALVKKLSKQLLNPKDMNKQDWIEANTHPDFMMIQPSETGRISIEVIRESIHFLANTPAASSIKVLVIVEAEKMNGAAQSALLKTLEEPPGHAYIFLTTENSHQLLATMRSRCQKQIIPFPSPLDLESWLESHGHAAGMCAEAVYLAKTLANGSPGLVLALLTLIREQSSPEAIKKSLGFLLYLLSIIASNWKMIPGLSLFVENRLGLFLPEFVFLPKTLQDKKRKIEFYRYVCDLRKKVQSIPSINANLLLHSIENF